ncbi:hypothetical protein [Echinococcus multilocularis]|uniref:Uncharacterized protein n=1 Tax=Echinococcus multilocularis TaxID=6211 RepID=A0A068Y996_ECHMU|nr:hypothetical protein [Echinococcus multilocularis]
MGHNSTATNTTHLTLQSLTYNDHVECRNVRRAVINSPWFVGILDCVTNGKSNDLFARLQVVFTANLTAVVSCLSIHILVTLASPFAKRRCQSNVKSKP